ncbi:MAG TPA: SulP family inorganic anion transporter [Acidimicrobiia bacterium]|jgi:high affinity sulfate transporter 1
MARTAERVGPGSARARWIAVLGGIRPYDRTKLARDVLAGVTLAALAIPEVMGYTKIAGTPVITGLYTILLPAIVFGVFASSRHLVVGGDSATAAILFAGIAGLDIAGVQPGTQRWLAFASMAALITGGLLLVARVARLGFLADFISRTVLVGFLTGVGVEVALGQLAGMLGVASPKVAAGRVDSTLIKAWDTLKEIDHASLTTFAVSLGVILTLVVFAKWIRAIPGGLVAVVGVIALSWLLDLQSHGVAVLGSVPRGLPSFGFPSGLTRNDAVRLVGTSVSMFLVILAQSAATSRAYAVRYRDKLVENNDLVGLGLANLAAAFTGTFVVNGSPTKTEMADEAGATSQIAMLAMAGAVAIVLLFLTKPLEYLPEAALSAVVFVVGVKLIDVAHMREIARLRRDEFVIAAVTTAVVICVGVEQGILLAIVLSLLDHVRRHYDPRDSVLVGPNREQHPVGPGVVTEPGLIVYRFGVGLFYANAGRLADDVMLLVDGPEPPKWFVLHAEAIDDVDFTGGKTIVELAQQLKARGIVFAVAGADPTVAQEAARFGLLDVIGREHAYPHVQDAIAAFHAAEGHQQ